MRRVLSLILLLATAGGSIAGLWMWPDVVAQTVTTWWMVEEKTWVEKPIVKVDMSFTGADIQALEFLSKQIAAFLTPFDSRLRMTSIDTPQAQVNLSVNLPPPAVLPMRELAQKMIKEQAAQHNPARAAKNAQGPRKSMKGLKGRRSAAGRRVVVVGPAAKKIQDLKHRREVLMKTWREADSAHERAMEARKQYRHPEELLKADPEAMALKGKLVDLEMTMAEVIDHYTPAHPRVRDLQTEIASVRSGLDRRVLIAETEEQERWENRIAGFQQKKRLLDREDKELERQTVTRTIVSEEPSSAPAPDVAAADTTSLDKPGMIQSAEGAMLVWSETETVTRELVTEKRMDGQKAAAHLTAATITLIVAGYLLGIFGFFGPSNTAAAPEHTAGADVDVPTPPFGRAPAKARKPLPPIESPPAPPAPEKILEESELPGEVWAEIPVLPKVEKGLYTVFAPTSPASDFFSRTAENLLAKIPKTDGSQAVSVAAIRSGAGTSTFLANLAVAVASRRPVLLIDLHHTAPSLHNFFGINATPRDLMSSGPWSQCVIQTPIERLFLLPLFAPHLEKEMADLKVKKRLQTFLKDNPLNRLILLDVAPLGRSDLFEEVAEISDLFVLILGPDPTPASAKPALRRMSKAMKKKPILRLVRIDREMPQALAARPAPQYEFAAQA